MSVVPADFELWHRFTRFLRARGFEPDGGRRSWTKRGPFETAVIDLDERYPMVRLTLLAEDGAVAARSTVDLTDTDELDWDNLILPFDQVFDLPFDD